MKKYLRKRQISCLCLAMAMASVPPLAVEAPVTTQAESPDLNLPELDEAGRLETILARFDQAQASIRTLTADFDELKELALLADPVEGSGRFYYATPHQAGPGRIVVPSWNRDWTTGIGCLESNHSEIISLATEAGEASYIP